ncbi:MAG: OadG family protein [Clostridia bacterium]|nr:OadG family protein [Clostridia bacterium]
MGEVSSLFVTLLGMGTTFFGLICIIVLSLIMSFFCRLGKKQESSKTAVPAPASAPKANNQIPNKGEFVAAISAAIAEDMGTDVSAIKILSIKKV